MLSLLRRPFLGAVGVTLLLGLTAAPAFAQFETEYDPGTPEFQRTWDRTDRPVEEGVESRTWMWGPGRTEVMMEEYVDSPGGERQVQYFDKTRMEINDPTAVDDGLWFVTNGLLVVELIEGRMQTGDATFEDRSPADVHIAGDPGNEFAPTYADINDLGLRAMPADDVGDLITRTLTGDNQVTDDDHFAQYDVTAAFRVQVPTIDQTVASPFWDFMNSEGAVYEDGEFVDDLLFINPFYAVGYPITPAFWSVVPILGEEQDVLWQCFERRCLTYTPSNPEGFQVEAGNVGQHYWLWRYDMEPPPPPPPPEDFDGDYFAELEEFNDSGVSGLALLTLDGDQLTVEIEASGLTPDEQHFQHVHGFMDGDGQAALQGVTISTCASADAYGPVLIPLDPFPTADEDGNVSYSATIDIDPEMLGDPTTRTIVMHGMEIDGEYNAGIAVACGEIQEGEAPEPPPTDYDGEYYAELDEFNDSGVSGLALLALEGDQLMVTIEASGLTPDEEHFQHIHGFANGNGDNVETGLQGVTISTCTDADSYGPVLIPLQPFPTADEDGNVSYSATLDIDPEELGDPTTRTIVMHGMEVDGEYNAGIAVACGEIQEGEAPEPPPPPEEEQTYMLWFGELNNSGVSGSGAITLDGDQLTVSINASGLEADMVHPQHIHGHEDSWAFCPGPDFDTDGNGMVEIGEGVPAYGPVVQPLFSDVDAEEYPTADAGGNVAFEMTYTVDAETIGSLRDRVVVLHGLTVEDEYVAGQPVACALVVPTDAVTYAAPDLSGENVEDPVTSDGSGEALFWYDEAAGELFYMLVVNDLPDVTVAHIHEGAAGESGPPVLWLFNAGAPEEGVAAFGILSSGRATAADLVGSLEGLELSDLIATFGEDAESSGAYVNVHTVTYPGGEIRDQVYALGNFTM